MRIAYFLLLIVTCFMAGVSWGIIEEASKTNGYFSESYNEHTTSNPGQY